MKLGLGVGQRLKSYSRASLKSWGVSGRSRDEQDLLETIRYIQARWKVNIVTLDMTCITDSSTISCGREKGKDKDRQQKVSTPTRFRT
jgi:hypothetical protein